MADEPNNQESLARQLLDRQSESRSLDYKAAISFGPSKADKAKVLKWLMSFANTRDGGNIMIGVEESGGKFVPIGVSEAQISSFDPTMIGDLARQYCSVVPVVSSVSVTLDGKTLLLLIVEEFEDEPIVCTRNIDDARGRPILTAGSLYVRTVDAKCVAVASAEDMKRLLDLAVQKRGDVLLHQIRHIVGAGGIQPPAEPSDLYGAEMASASELFQAEGLIEGVWCVEIFPAGYDSERVGRLESLREIRRNTAVSIRGWDFPHVDQRGETPNVFEDGIQSVTHWGRYHEAHRLYRSGLFVWRRSLAEDQAAGHEGSLSYESSIYSLTEFFIFASRYASEICKDQEVCVKVSLNGLEGRMLKASPGVNLWDDHKSAAKKFERPALVISIAELRATHLDLARQYAQRLFEYFDLSVDDEVLMEWQAKFIERRL